MKKNDEKENDDDEHHNNDKKIENNLNNEKDDDDDNNNNNKDNKEKEEEQSIRDYINELLDRFNEKRKKRFENDVKNIDYPDDDFFIRLDTSIKKNTAFVKKIRNMNEMNKDLIMKDLENLNLSRFITELTLALVETKIKLNEINIFIQICQFLHYRYQDFHINLFDTWNKLLPHKSSDQFNASKMRVDIKIFTELILIGIFPSKESLPSLGNLLTILTTTDKESHKNLNILITFCRSYAIEFMGLYPKQQLLLAKKFNLHLPKCDFLNEDRQRSVRTLFKDYYQSLIQHINNDYKQLTNLKNDMKRHLETRGEISEKLQEKWKIKLSEFEKLYQSTLIFADLINENIPDNINININQLENDQTIMKNENITAAVLFDLNRFKENNFNNTLWDDEETRLFYENIPDLKSLVPAMLYKDSLKDDTNTTSSTTTVEQQQQQQQQQNDSSNENLDDDLLLTNDDTKIPDPKDVPLLNENDDIDPSEQSSSSTTTTTLSKDDNKTNNNNVKTRNIKLMNNNNVTKDQLEQYFSSLPNCVNCDFIDKAAIHFATTFNTKNNRKKLVDVLIRVPRTRLDLLPFYSRFVAQLSPIMPSVSNDLCVGLKNQFRYNFHKKDQVYIESKVKIVRFIGELVKFKIFPKTEALKILKTLLSDFHHHHIEMTCNLFEVCGRYLYRCPESHHMTNLLLQQMMRLKNHMYVNTRYETMIQNAYYSCTSDGDKLLRNMMMLQTKPIIHQYIEYLIYNELTRKTVSLVLKKFRRLNWNDRELCKFIIKTLSSVWNIKCDNISALANLLSNLSQNYSKIVIMVLDEIIENIRLGMQMNSSIEYNQRRISTIKYFAECFNYNLFDTTLLFNIMYSLLLYGVDYNDPKNSLIDPPFNLMRLRLIAQILHICGHFLMLPVAKKKLDFFLYFYQRYYWLKKSYIISLPSEQIDQMSLLYIDAIFIDVIQFLRPKFKKSQSYQQACEQLEQRLNQLTDNIKDVLPNVNVSTIKNIIKQQQQLIINESNKQSTTNDLKLEPINEDSENETTINDGDNSGIVLNNNNDNDDVNNMDNDDEFIINDDDDVVNDNVNEDYDDDNDMEMDNNDNDVDDADDDDDCDVDDDDDENDEDDDEDNDDDDDDNDDDNDENDDEDDDDEDQEKNNVNGSSLRIQHCEEDDEFQRDFERLMMENLQTRSQEINQRMNVEIVIPIERDNMDKSSSSSSSSLMKNLINDSSIYSLESSSSSSLNNQNTNQNYNFRIITKNQKSNKPILKTIEVPSNSDLVQNFLQRKQQQKREKECVKKLILGINERREILEDQIPSATKPLPSSSSSTTTNQIINSDNLKLTGGYNRSNNNNNNNYRKRFQ